MQVHGFWVQSEDWSHIPKGRLLLRLRAPLQESFQDVLTETKQLLSKPIWHLLPSQQQPPLGTWRGRPDPKLSLDIQPSGFGLWFTFHPITPHHLYSQNGRSQCWNRRAKFCIQVLNLMFFQGDLVVQEPKWAIQTQVLAPNSWWPDRHPFPPPRAACPHPGNSRDRERWLQNTG